MGRTYMWSKAQRTSTYGFVSPAVDNTDNLEGYSWRHSIAFETTSCHKHSEPSRKGMLCHNQNSRLVPEAPGIAEGHANVGVLSSLAGAAGISNLDTWNKLAFTNPSEMAGIRSKFSALKRNITCLTGGTA